MLKNQNWIFTTCNSFPLILSHMSVPCQFEQSHYIKLFTMKLSPGYTFDFQYNVQGYDPRHTCQICCLYSTHSTHNETMVSNVLIKICATQHCTTLVHLEGPRQRAKPKVHLLWIFPALDSQNKCQSSQIRDACFSRRTASPSWMGFALSRSPSWTTTSSSWMGFALSNYSPRRTASPLWMGFALSLGPSRGTIPLLLITSNGLRKKVANLRHKLTFHVSIFACSFSISCFILSWFSGVNSPSPSRSLHLLQALAKNSLSSALALILWSKKSMW